MLRVRKKGVTILPKALREAAGITEESQVKARVVPSGLLLRPMVTDPVRTLEDLPTAREEPSVTSVRKLRRRIHGEQLG